MCVFTTIVAAMCLQKLCNNYSCQKDCWSTPRGVAQKLGPDGAAKCLCKEQLERADVWEWCAGSAILSATARDWYPRLWPDSSRYVAAAAANADPRLAPRRRRAS